MALYDMGFCGNYIGHIIEDARTGRENLLNRASQKHVLAALLHLHGPCSGQDTFLFL